MSIIRTPTPAIMAVHPDVDGFSNYIDELCISYDNSKNGWEDDVAEKIRAKAKECRMKDSAAEEMIPLAINRVNKIRSILRKH